MGSTTRRSLGAPRTPARIPRQAGVRAVRRRIRDRARTAQLVLVCHPRFTADDRDKWRPHFSEQRLSEQPNRAGQGDVAALLRRVADFVDVLIHVQVQDVTFHSEVADGEDGPSMTVYYSRKPRRRVTARDRSLCAPQSGRLSARSCPAAQFRRAGLRPALAEQTSRRARRRCRCRRSSESAAPCSACGAEARTRCRPPSARRRCW